MVLTMTLTLTVSTYGARVGTREGRTPSQAPSRPPERGSLPTLVATHGGRALGSKFKLQASNSKLQTSNLARLGGAAGGCLCGRPSVRPPCESSPLSGLRTLSQAERPLQNEGDPGYLLGSTALCDVSAFSECQCFTIQTRFERRAVSRHGARYLLLTMARGASRTHSEQRPL